VGIVEEQADNFLNAAFAMFVKALRSVGFGSEQGFGTIEDWHALVWGETGLAWTGMFKLNEQVLDTTWHIDATLTFYVGPFDINTRKFIPSHVELDPMVFLEKIKEMVEVFDPNIFDPKVIYDKAELDGVPFVAPETRGGISFIVAFGKEARSEEIVGQDVSLGKAKAALENFEVDPTVRVTTRKLVLLNEFRWDVGDLDANIFRVGHWHVEVEVLKVNGAEARSFAREHTIEQQLEEFKGCSVGANIPREADVIASDGDASAIQIIFIRPNLTNDHGVADFFSFVGWYVMIINDKEGVGACNLFGIGGGPRANSLTQRSKLIGIQRITCSLVARILTWFGNAQEIRQWMGQAQRAQLGCLAWTMIGRAPRIPATSVGGMVLQSPVKPDGSIGDRMVLAVGIWYFTLLWRGLPVVKSASGVGAGALVWVRWDMGSCGGKLGGGIGACC
jgi:hypothetical protein